MRPAISISDVAGGIASVPAIDCRRFLTRAKTAPPASDRRRPLRRRGTAPPPVDRPQAWHRRAGDGSRRSRRRRELPTRLQVRSLDLGLWETDHPGPTTREHVDFGSRVAAQAGGDGGPTGPGRLCGPAPRDQLTVPAQDGRRGDEQPESARTGSSRLRAAITARSAQLSLGRLGRRRSTASWWRRTRISISLLVSHRAWC